MATLAVAPVRFDLRVVVLTVAQELLKVQHGQAQAHQNLLDDLHLVVQKEVEPNEKKIWIWPKKATWSNKFAYAVVYFFKCNGTGWL